MDQTNGATNATEESWAVKNLDDFGEYCFETDQLSLKGNADYQALLKTLVVLEGQRIIASLFIVKSILNHFSATFNV